MKVAVIVVRKRWNNAPSFLVEGIKKGLTDAIIDGESAQIDFSFVRFAIHEPDKLWIDPEEVKKYDVLLIPFWIGERILNCNLLELKKMGLRICLYTGIAPYNCRPPFDFSISAKEMRQGQLSDLQWETLNAVDKFFVVKKTFPFDKEIEIGCGQFEEWLKPDKSKTDCILIDFCKKEWDEFVWHEFAESWDEMKSRPNLRLIQFGEYPARLDESCVFKRPFLHYRRICKIYGKIKIFVAMNESFGYPILENKLAGNMVLVHENSQLPNFHLKSSFVVPWNSSNLKDKIFSFLDEYNQDTSRRISQEFQSNNPNLMSWKRTVKRLTDELQKI